MVQADSSALAAHSAATVYEASGKTGMLDPGIRLLWRGARICGPARCIRSRRGDNLALHRVLTMAEPGEVLVVATGRDLLHGAWGEVMTEAALARSVAGLVTDGAVRDSEAIERLGFPVFAPGTAVGSCSKVDPGSIDEPIEIGGITIRPGDTIVADSDGAVFVAADRVQDVARAAREREAHERQLIQHIRRGKTTYELLRLGDP